MTSESTLLIGDALKAPSPLKLCGVHGADAVQLLLRSVNAVRPVDVPVITQVILLVVTALILDGFALYDGRPTSFPVSPALCFTA